MQGVRLTTTYQPRLFVVVNIKVCVNWYQCLSTSSVFSVQWFSNDRKGVKSTGTPHLHLSANCEQCCEHFY